MRQPGLRRLGIRLAIQNEIAAFKTKRDPSTRYSEAQAEEWPCRLPWMRISNAPRTHEQCTERRCGRRDLFQNEMGPLRLKRKQPTRPIFLGYLVAQRLPYEQEGATVAHSDQDDLELPSEVRGAGTTAPVAYRTMKLKHTSLAIALMVLVGFVGYAQAPRRHQTLRTPAFRVQVWGYIVADFSTRVWSYFELRSELEKGLPALTVTDDPAEIRTSGTCSGKEDPCGASGGQTRGHLHADHQC